MQDYQTQNIFSPGFGVYVTVLTLILREACSVEVFAFNSLLELGAVLRKLIHACQFRKAMEEGRIRIMTDEVNAQRNSQL